MSSSPRICFRITKEFGTPALVISHDEMIVEILEIGDEIDFDDPAALHDLGKAVVDYLRPA